MLTKKIIPCLDTKNGKVVKGVNFEDVREICDPLELAVIYNNEGADELTLYDITASIEGRTIFVDLLKRVADAVSIPLIVGGGIASIADVDLMRECGADKFSINTGALKNPMLLEQAAKKYGSKSVVMAMDVKRVGGRFIVFTNGGMESTGIDAMEWAKKCEGLGAGEIVLNSIDTDGVKNGYDLEMLGALLQAVRIPVVASGGAGKMEDFLELFEKLPNVESALAASVFHYREIKIPELKAYLRDGGVNVAL